MTQSPQPALPNLAIAYDALLEGAPDATLLLDPEQDRILDANRQAQMLFGLSAAELAQRSLASLCPPLQADGRDSALAASAWQQQALAGKGRMQLASFLHSGGRRIDCELRLLALHTPERRLLQASIIDISLRQRAEALRNGQSALLEMVARGDPLRATLDKLMLLIEMQTDGVYCSVMLLAEDGLHIRTGSGPSLPPDYLQALEGLAIGPAAGSCGTALYLKQPVIVTDIEHDPLWLPYRQLAMPHGLRACWSIPIVFDRDTVLGTFAMYYKEVRSPSAADRHLIELATHLAGIAIARARHEEELGRHRVHLEQLVTARTTELTLAKEQAEMASDELATALDNLSMTQDELVRRDKLAALGALVAGVAHELNTPVGNSLMVASTMSERTAALRAELPSGLRRSALDTYLNQAAEADTILLRNLNRVAELVANFKRLAVDARGTERRDFLLGELVAELLPALLAASGQSGVTVRHEVAAGLAMDSYPGPLSQALGNLFENSLLHGLAERRGGTITLRGWRTEQGEIALALSDDGVGIPAEHQAHVYDPFFTTRLGAGGSGLGLHITYNIVTGILGGRIELDSASGRGTTFTLLLPPVAPR